MKGSAPGLINHIRPELVFAGCQYIGDRCCTLAEGWPIRLLPPLISVYCLASALPYSYNS